MEDGDSEAQGEFALPSMGLDDLLSQLIERAQDVKGAQSRLRGLLEANRSIVSDPLLKDVFGRPEDLLPGTSSRKCAMLLDVTGVDAATKRRELRCRIVVLKPRVIVGAPLDVLQYAGAHPSFPNESTAQQFCDEAQWESYRRLGVAVGQTVFGLDDATSPGHADALWKRLWWR